VSTERRLLLALGLSLLILVLWNWLNPPPPAIPPPPPPDGAAPATEATAPAAPPASGGRQGEIAPRIEAAEPRDVRIETDHHEVLLTNRGGRLVSWKLRGYRVAGGHLAELVPAFASSQDRFPLGLDLGEDRLSSEANDALYVVERAPLESDSGETVRFRYADGAGLEIDKSFTFRRDDPLVRVQVRAERAGRPLPAKLVVGPGFEVELSSEGSKKEYLYYSGQAVWNEGGQVVRRAREKVEAEIHLPEIGGLRWAGLEDQYFAFLVVPRGPASGLRILPAAVSRQPVSSRGEGKAPKPEPQLSVAVGIPPEGAEIYAGPKKLAVLRSLGRDLESVVWFSRFAFIAWLAKLLLLVLVWLHDHLAPNYGLAIIIATLGLRIALFPLNQYSMVRMKKMQVQMQRLQPKIASIRNKYRKQKDTEARRKMNEELMALYRKEGVNPMGGMSGCLPLLAQFPILVAFYDMLTVAVELRGAPFFGWIGDLSRPDPYWVTPLLMGATMLWQQRIAMTKTTDPQQRQQQLILMFMPVVFTATFVAMPSGLVLYWLFNNLFGIAQQWLVNRHVERVAAALQKA